jgi:hypothetical protein
VSNHPEGGKIPREVNFELKYFQVTQNEKRLIEGTVLFSKFLKPTAKELSGEQPIKYNLSFNYIPMTHSELIVSFAFSWEIYLIMYLAVGLIAIIITMIFHIYHMLLFRFLSKKKKKI